MPQQIERTVRRASDKTPRTTKVVDALIDAGAKFRAVYSAQIVVLANGQHVYVVSNAEDVVAGRTSHEFVDILVPLVDTNRLDEMVAKVLELSAGSRDTAAGISRAIAETVKNQKDEVVADMLGDNVRHVRLTNGQAYFVRQVARDGTSNTARYAVVRDATQVPATIAARYDVVVDPHSHFGDKPVCISCSATDCSHVDAVKAFRIGMATATPPVADSEAHR